MCAAIPLRQAGANELACRGRPARGRGEDQIGREAMLAPHGRGGRKLDANVGDFKGGIADVDLGQQRAEDAMVGVVAGLVRLPYKSSPLLATF